MEMISEIMNLKKQKRKGWVTAGRNMNPKEVESVSDHSWAASMIALLYLPEKLGNNHVTKEYNKEKIIKMLIIHDLAEAFVGDIIHGMKTQKDRETERERFLFYSWLNNTKYMSRLYGINELWEEFEELQTFNSQVAKAIDQIESWIQLNIYKDELIRKNGADRWNLLKQEWKKNILIRTYLGKELYDHFLKMFDTSEDVL